MDIHRAGLILFPLVIAGVTFTAVAADGPTGNVGLKSSKPTVVDLGPEFIPMNGWQLRLQGTDTVTRNDGSSQTFYAGDTTGEPGTTVHWHKNDGKDDVIFVTADIIKAESPK
jgi:hypothetical protein